MNKGSPRQEVATQGFRLLFFFDPSQFPHDGAGGDGGEFTHQGEEMRREAGSRHQKETSHHEDKMPITALSRDSVKGKSGLCVKGWNTIETARELAQALFKRISQGKVRSTCKRNSQGKNPSTSGNGRKGWGQSSF